MDTRNDTHAIKSQLRSLLIALLFLPALAFAQPAPDTAAGFVVKQPAHGKKYMVAAAHPLAVESGAAILKRGGSAVDAAIATALVLNLVEPHASGIGGGGFLLHLDKQDESIVAYDGRETAPAAATPDLFLDSNAKPLQFFDAVVGGRSVGVPGLLRMFEVAHARHGKLEWAMLFQPAIRIAEKGFPISQGLAAEIIAESARLKGDPAARAYFFHPDGSPRKEGEILRNPQFAAVLKRVANQGADIFYTGLIAKDIVAAVKNHALNPGHLSLNDIQGYKARVREAVCGPYRAYVICGMPPPSSGAIAVLQILGVLERFDLAAMRPTSVDAIHLFSEAGRLAFADRNAYVADPDFIDVPTSALLDTGYLHARGQLVRLEKSMGRATPGEPAPQRKVAAVTEAMELPSTSHISIVDAAGNAVSLTQSIEHSFGSHIMVRGFLLNNELTDFSFEPTTNGAPVANRVQPGKRPRSSMAPMLVFDKKKNLIGVVGSPGGSSIINYVAKVLVGVIDWRLDLQQAIDGANFGSRNGPTELEVDRGLEPLEGPLKALGHEVKFMEMNSGVHAIWRTKNGWIGAADPRRDGSAKGK
jgi:gamma-glutamyltranspeptidase / glutathione hydrolase